MFLAGLNSSCTVVVTVQDENNNPPVFSQHEVRAFLWALTQTLAQNVIKKIHTSPNNTTQRLLSGQQSSCPPFNLRLIPVLQQEF